MQLETIWAKRSRRADGQRMYRPLLCHSVDIAEVSKLLLEHVISPAVLRWLAEGLGIDVESATRWGTIGAGVHDTGKSFRGFQCQVDGNATETPHGAVSTRILKNILQQPPFELQSGLANRIALVIGGHHGVIPKSKLINEIEILPVSRRWSATWPALIARFIELYPVPDAKPVRLDNARAMWLAGFISVADWIASNSDYFNFAFAEGAEPESLDLDAYRREIAAPAAERALRELGWLATPAMTEARSFTELFPKITRPNHLQEETIRVAEAMDAPGLVIIEAPMGEGKTEAALYLADRAATRWQMRGFYVALPTMATSNQIFDRVRDFLNRRYPDDFVQIQLLHGHASLSKDIEALKESFKVYLAFAEKIGEIDGEGEPAAQASAVASSWFTGRKKGMLSPFGVGTIDQALLSVLPTKHFFVRLFGLAGKTVILDEVHAYDAYTTTLLEGLIQWLAAMGCHVILLSATLPSARRVRLLAAYRQGALGDISIAPFSDDRSYPRISWASGNASGSEKVHTSDRGKKQLAIRWLTLRKRDGDTQLAEELDRVLANGGCAAVVCNTVQRAQEVYEALCDSQRFREDELDLFHARFLFKERQAREKCCRERFGPPNADGSDTKDRPTRMVLVATQVIEQSLDLDFDLLVTELAPIDLMLQRAGRMHRHARLRRPAGLEAPYLWILLPEIDGDAPPLDPRFGDVYYQAILLRSWWALKDVVTVDVPGDVSTLIEAVYDESGELPDSLTDHQREFWIKAADELARAQRFQAGEAEQWRIAWPGTGNSLGRIAPIPLEDEDDDVNPRIRAKTRLTDPSVTVVCHWGPINRARFEKCGPEWNLTAPTHDIVRRCLENSVSIRRWNVVKDLQGQAVPSAWKRNGMLRQLRHYSLDDDDENAGRTWRLDFASALGVKIEGVNGGERIE